MMLVVFAGGGTGGHIFPGIALADSLKRVCDAAEFEFWGAGRALETDLLARQDVRFRALPAAPIPRTPTAVPGFFFSLAAGYMRSRRLLKSLGVRAVVGLGGYSSFAPVFAASRLGLPTFLLEQNAIVGRANLRLAKRVKLVCLSWHISRGRLPRGAKAEVTGNPVRRGIVEAARTIPYNPRGAVLILGGSTGAVGLNTAVLGAAKDLGTLGREIIHQTGENDLDRVRGAYREAGVEATVTAFIDDMGSAYRAAAVVIARAGGTTLAEIALFGIPAILVPYPHHRDQHQRANAEIFAVAGAAGIIEQGEAAAMGAWLRELAASPERLERMHAASLALGRPDAADKVAALILKSFEGGGGP